MCKYLLEHTGGVVETWTWKAVVLTTLRGLAEKHVSSLIAYSHFASENYGENALKVQLFVGTIMAHKSMKDS